MPVPDNLTCEYFTNPIGLDVRQPRLSWKTSSSRRNALQSAYQIMVAGSAAALEAAASGQSTAGLLWDSGKVKGSASLHIPYAGVALQPGQRCYWRVRVWNEQDDASAWSPSAFWEMGLLDSSHWQADWITPDWDEDTSRSQPAPLLRRGFSLQSGVASARVYITSLGLYELHLNGQCVGDGVLTPGWTSYDHQVQYQTYDVTGLVHEGENALGVMLGDGWYRGFMGFSGNRNLYGDRLALILLLQVTYTNGAVDIIASDKNWRSTRGPIQMADIYMGETYDARQDKPGWDQSGYNDADWNGVRIYEHSKEILKAQAGPLIRRHEQIRPVKVIHSPKGETIIDFGQNMVGWVKVRARGPAGTTITIRHAEVLDQQGNFYTENLRTAKETNTFTLKGAPDADEVFEPHFTFQGFQYIAVEGFPGEPDLDHFTGIVLHSDTPLTGSFECSNPLINQLQHNIIWGQKGNFVDVPTDCPQRDERLGWTGDTQVFIRTACFNMNVAAFFTKWLRDLAADQMPNGSVTFVVPEATNRGSGGSSSGFPGAGSAAWSDAAVICPWTIYQCYADTRLLEEQYPSMAGWVNYMRSQADPDFIWRKGFHFGDWLDYRGPWVLNPSPVTNIELIATAFYAYSTEMLANAAHVLGKIGDAHMYSNLAAQVKAAFVKEFVSESGRIGPNTQTAYVLALHFDLLPEEMRAAAAARLAEEVRKAHYHLTTGFVGTPYLCHVLSRFGYTDIAYELLNQESYPSWLYPVKKGATTIWERWDGIKPDGSFQDAGMNSFNHYAYGAIGEWLYRVVAGIDVDPAEPGYQHILFQPQPGGGLTHARATLDSPYGLVASSWELTEGGLRLGVTVPANVHATLQIPASSPADVREGGQPLAAGNGIRTVHTKGNTVLIEVGSGNYEFTTTGLTLAKVMASVRHIAGRLDRTSSLREWLANETGKAALTQLLGDLLKGPMINVVMNTPLEQMTQFVPQLLTEEKFAELEAAVKPAG